MPMATSMAPFASGPGRRRDPMADRSFISVVRATRQPSPTAPMRFSSGTRGVGHVDLVELGLARDLTEGSHLDARRVHVEGEVGHALVLGLLRVGAGDQHPPVGEVGHGVPHLLAVHHPLVAVAQGTGAEAGEVAPGAGLAEQLAPPLLAGEHRPQEAALHLVGAVRDDRRPRQRHEEQRRVLRPGPGGADAFLHHPVQVRAGTQTTETDREVHPRQAGVVAGAAEGAFVELLGVVRAQQLVDGVFHTGALGVTAHQYWRRS